MKLAFRFHGPLLLATLALSTPQKAGAVGIRLLHQDADAVARGNAFTATADNPAALYYNPAGITQLPGQNAELNTFTVGYDVQYSGNDGRRADTPDKVQEVGQLFYSAALPARGLFLGIGVYAPYGLSSTWEDGAPFRSISTESKLIYATVNPVLAWKVTDAFSVAGGVTVNAAHIDLRRGILAPRDEFQFDGDGIGVGFNVGALWQPSAQHSFGAKFFSANDIDFDGHSEIHSETPLFFPSSRIDSRATFKFPLHVTGGYSFRPTPKWNFEFDLDWTDWNRINSVNVRQRGPDLTEVFDWNSSFTYMAGVTRYFDHGLSLSAGYTYAESSTPDANYHPSVPDMNFHIASLGLHYTAARWSVGLAYQFGYGDRDVSGSLPSPIGETADGHYRFLSHAVALSVGAKF